MTAIARRPLLRSGANRNRQRSCDDLGTLKSHSLQSSNVSYSSLCSIEKRRSRNSGTA